MHLGINAFKSLIFQLPKRPIFYLLTLQLMISCNYLTFDLNNYNSKPQEIPPSYVPPQLVEKFITVDQMGYRPQDKKIAVIKKPIIGLDSGSQYNPGNLFELRSLDKNQLIFQDSAQTWNAGSVSSQSGDKGWLFDFSRVEAVGSYYILDVENNVRSPIFKIRNDVYKEVLKTATRFYYYQRSGVAKSLPFAESCWTDSASYIYPNQDTQAESLNHYLNPSGVVSAKRDLSGGWFDAGDTNKYTTFALDPINQLFTSYEENKSVYTDDFNIPESGNGIPDILDEIQWEIEWLKKMQNSDGSFILKVGKINETPGYDSVSPPSVDRDFKYYIPSCSSATIAGAAMLSQAAYVYSKIPALVTESVVLQGRALNAFNNFRTLQNNNQLQSDCDNGTIHAGDADFSIETQEGTAVVAAIYLYALTLDNQFQNFIINQYQKTHPFTNTWDWGRYETYQGNALIFYTQLPQANSLVKNAILNRKKTLINNTSNKIYSSQVNDHLYQAFIHDEQYHWGSNKIRANYANNALDALRIPNTTVNSNSIKERALGMLHYYHGVNPFGWTYLTNMYSHGASLSINKIFHSWFSPQSKWAESKISECGPPPGFLVGGPNKNTTVCSSGSRNQNNQCTSGVPLSSEPIDKAYRDTNIGWNYTTQQQESGWEVAEPAIYYQAAYIRLLANFID